MAAALRSARSRCSRRGGPRGGRTAGRRAAQCPRGSGIRSQCDRGRPSLGPVRSGSSAPAVMSSRSPPCPPCRRHPSLRTRIFPPSASRSPPPSRIRKKKQAQEKTKRKETENDRSRAAEPIDPPRTYIQPACGACVHGWSRGPGGKGEGEGEGGRGARTRPIDREMSYLSRYSPSPAGAGR